MYTYIAVSLSLCSLLFCHETQSMQRYQRMDKKQAPVLPSSALKLSQKSIKGLLFDCLSRHEAIVTEIQEEFLARVSPEVQEKMRQAKDNPATNGPILDLVTADKDVNAWCSALISSDGALCRRYEKSLSKRATDLMLHWVYYYAVNSVPVSSKP